MKFLLSKVECKMSKTNYSRDQVFALGFLVQIVLTVSCMDAKTEDRLELKPRKIINK